MTDVNVGTNGKRITTKVKKESKESKESTEKNSKIIILTSECGLSYCGNDEEDEPEFVGTEKEWRKFQEKLDNLDNLDNQGNQDN